MVATVEPEEVRGPCVSQRKTAAQPFTLSRCTSQAGCHCSSARFDFQLSGKAHEDSDRHPVLAHLPSWQNCERCNNFFPLPFGIPFARFNSSKRIVPPGLLPLSTSYDSSIYSYMPCFRKYLAIYVLFVQLKMKSIKVTNNYSTQ